jgi:hypothetical protein
MCHLIETLRIFGSSRQSLKVALHLWEGSPPLNALTS